MGNRFEDAGRQLSGRSETGDPIEVQRALTKTAFDALMRAEAEEEAHRVNDLWDAEIEFGAMSVWSGDLQVPHTD